MTHSKASKFIIKTLCFFPFVFVLWTAIYSDFDIANLIFPSAVSLFISAGIVFYNVFDYEKFNELKIEDFLESNHKISLENTELIWSKIDEVFSNNFTDKVLEKNENIIKIRIERKLLDSILIAERMENKISIEIKKKRITFLPDNAQNFKTIHRLEKKIKTIADREVESTAS